MRVDQKLLAAFESNPLDGLHLLYENLQNDGIKEVKKNYNLFVEHEQYDMSMTISVFREKIVYFVYIHNEREAFASYESAMIFFKKMVFQNRYMQVSA